MWVPQKLPESVSTPIASTFPEIFNRLLFQSIPRMCGQNLKSMALSVPIEVLGGKKGKGTVSR